jgi:hypothetical protein
VAYSNTQNGRPHFQHTVVTGRTNDHASNLQLLITTEQKSTHPTALTETIFRIKERVGEGVGLQSPPPPQKNRYLKKKVDFFRHCHQGFNVIYPSAEISHWNRLMTSALEFSKLKRTPATTNFGGTVISFIFHLRTLTVHSKAVTLQHRFQINQPTRCNKFSSLDLDIYSYVQLNTFRVFSRPSSGAQQLQ